MRLAIVFITARRAKNIQLGSCCQLNNEFSRQLCGSLCRDIYFKSRLASHNQSNVAMGTTRRRHRGIVSCISVSVTAEMSLYYCCYSLVPCHNFLNIPVGSVGVARIQIRAVLAHSERAAAGVRATMKVSLAEQHETC